MSKIMVVGAVPDWVETIAQAWVEPRTGPGVGVVSVSPGETPVDEPGRLHRVADPGSAAGRGLIGDLYRQQGPFTAVLHVLKDEGLDADGAEGFPARGLDEDLSQLNASIATFLTLAKSAVSLSAPDADTENSRESVPCLTLWVTADGTSRKRSALAEGASAFMRAFTAALGDLPGVRFLQAEVTAQDLHSQPRSVVTALFEGF
ncbi:MAG: hypothetical protein V2I45_08605 [Halieaceae bacterium]|nr:hypothetical protein [Halieaceae bacterium]